MTTNTASQPSQGVTGCASCGHPSAQHDDGGCMFPKWDKNGGTTCGCAAFEPVGEGSR